MLRHRKCSIYGQKAKLRCSDSLYFPYVNTAHQLAACDWPRLSYSLQRSVLTLGYWFVYNYSVLQLINTHTKSGLTTVSFEEQF
jgi:hypothetical protein